jgi:hypothetical protein
MPRRVHHRSRPRRRPINFGDINRAARAQSHTLLAELLPGGVVHANEYVVLNPRRKDVRRGSFSINMRSGLWGDFAIGAYGGDFISLCAYVLDIAPRHAAEVVACIVGVGESASVDNCRFIR